MFVLGNLCIFSSCASNNKDLLSESVDSSIMETPLRDEETITIFSTNDIHGSLINDEKNKTIGAVKLAEIKASKENSILVDGGDATQGASFASITRGEDVITMMNETGYDVMVAGNHEFDYGYNVLLNNDTKATFPILASNVKKGGDDFLNTYAIIEKANYKIGFIGLTTISTSTSTNPSLLSDITFEDEVETTKKEIAALKDQTDTIVLLTHMGNNESAVSCTSEQLLSHLSKEEQKEISVVFDGHSHEVEEKLYKNQDIEIPLIQAGVNFTHLGEVQLNFKDEKDGVKVTSSYQVMDYEEAMNYDINENGINKGNQVKQKLETIQKEQDEVLDEELCTLKKPLFGGYICYDYVESRLVETAYGDFVTDAFLASLKEFTAKESLSLPTLAIENGGGISQSLPTWYYNGTKVTRGDVLNAFNHGNLVEVLKVSPSDLFQVIEKGLVATGQDETGKLLMEKPSGSFIQCSGFSYKYNPSLPSGNKVVEIKLDNQQILNRSDTEKTLLVATNNYVSTFFNSAEKLGELGGEDLIVEDYILKLSQENDGVLDYRCTYDRILLDEDMSTPTYEVKLLVKNGETVCKNRQVHLYIDDEEVSSPYMSDDEGYITIVDLQKGAHVFKLQESSNYVYVNNYSGTGISNTKEGYYQFCFNIAQ